MGNTYFEHKSGRGPRWSEGKEHVRSSAEEEGNATLFAGCVGSDRNGTRHLRLHHVVLCKVSLVGTWIKRREVVDGARRIRSEKLREHHYRGGYARFLEGKRVK